MCEKVEMLKAFLFSALDGGVWYFMLTLSPDDLQTRNYTGDITRQCHVNGCKKHIWIKLDVIAKNNALTVLCWYC
jgi:hypothetical protein